MRSICRACSRSRPASMSRAMSACAASARWRPCRFRPWARPTSVLTRRYRRRSGREGEAGRLLCPRAGQGCRDAGRQPGRESSKRLIELMKAKGGLKLMARIFAYIAAQGRRSRRFGRRTALPRRRRSIPLRLRLRLSPAGAPNSMPSCECLRCLLRRGLENRKRSARLSQCRTGSQGAGQAYCRRTASCSFRTTISESISRRDCRSS